MTALAEIQGHTFYLPALGPGSVVFDLGAAGGGFGRAVHEMTGCRSLCADASPHAYEVLAAAPGIEAHHVALGGVDGPTEMQIGGYEGEKFWVRGAEDGAAAETIEVEGVTLATFMTRAGVDFVDLVKLDIEGAEFAFFDAAADETLKRVGQWSVEFHDFLDPALAPKVAAVIRRLEGLGFETVVMTRRGHGDVLFLNRAHLGLDPLRLFLMRTAVKYGRGMWRMLARKLGRAA
jgi:FkbM family methyltransferase